MGASFLFLEDIFVSFNDAAPKRRNFPTMLGPQQPPLDGLYGCALVYRQFEASFGAN